MWVLKLLPALLLLIWHEIDKYYSLLVRQVDGGIPKDGEYIFQIPIRPKNSKIELNSNNGVINKFLGGVSADLSNQVFYDSLYSFMIFNLSQGDQSMQLIHNSTTPIISIDANSDFEDFILQYNDDNYMLVNEGISISLLKFSKVIFSHTGNYILGFNGNIIYKKPMYPHYQLHIAR